MNFSPKLMIALSWLFLVAAIVVLAVEKEHKQTRVQAWQAVIFKLAGMVLMPFVSIAFFMAFPAAGILTAITDGIGAASFGGVFCCSFPVIFFLAAFVQIIPWVAIIMTLADKEFKIPLVYNWAEKLARKR